MNRRILIILVLLLSLFSQAQSAQASHLIHDYPALNSDGTVNVVIEIPAGTNEKWEVSKKKGLLKRDKKDGEPRTIHYLGYPGNYGMIPQTILARSQGGDNDPLDVILIGAPAKQGSIIKAKIIGVFRFNDKGERDDKLLAVMPGTRLYNIDSVQQLNESFPGVSEIIKTWFLYYKGSGKMVFISLDNRDAAMEILFEASKAYKDMHR